MQDTVVFPRMITKKKMATREVPISPKLQPILAEWKNLWPTLFKRNFEQRRRHVERPRPAHGEMRGDPPTLADHAFERPSRDTPVMRKFGDRCARIGQAQPFEFREKIVGSFRGSR